MLYKMTRGTKTRSFWLFANGEAEEIGLSGRIPDFAAEFIRMRETGWEVE